MTTPFSPPPGQGPIDPRGAFYPPPPPNQPNMQPPPYTQQPVTPPGGWQPPMMPPPGFFPPPPPRRRGGAVRIFFTVVGILVLVVSLLINFAFVSHEALNGGLASSGVRETTLISGDAQQKVAIIPVINDMILQSQADLFEKMLNAAEKDSAVKAVVLQVDTPGGGVTPSDEMHQRIVDFKARRAGVPIVVTMVGEAASGGYYLACAADYLFAEPTTITGSIGVLSPQYNFSKLAEKWGIEDTSIHATGAPYKTIGSPLKPPTTQSTEYFLSLIDSDFTQFKKVVIAGRKGKLTQPITDIANGKAYTADEALKLGLIDQIGYPAEAYAYAAKTAGLSHMTLVRYEAPPTLFELFNSKANLPPANASGGVQINGIQVNAQNLDGLLAPHLLYMWRGN